MRMAPVAMALGRRCGSGVGGAILRRSPPFEVGLAGLERPGGRVDERRDVGSVVVFAVGEPEVER